MVEQPQVLLHTQHLHSHTPPNTNVSGVANVKALVPNILRLQTQDKCKHQQYCCITHIQDNTKKRELLENPTKIEEIQEKNLLTEIEPLQHAF